jgi:hypothetical protein
METYKFELIHADNAQQITHVVSSKFKALLLSSVVDSFVEFAVECGFDKKAVLNVLQARIDEEAAV